MSCDDYCNNHGCNSGPSCPAGTGCHGLPGCKDTNCPGRPARVAKIGRKEHGREPLRGAAWRRYLKDLARAMLLVVAVMLVSAVTVALIPKKPGTNCAALIANWHPDVPAHIRAKCKEKQA